MITSSFEGLSEIKTNFFVDKLYALQADNSEGKEKCMSNFYTSKD